MGSMMGANLEQPLSSRMYDRLDEYEERMDKVLFKNTPITLNQQTLLTKSDGSSTEYYKFPTGFSDIIDLIEYKNMNFSIGNIFKACYRMGQKEGNDDAYDLRKIIFFAQRELKRIGTN